MAKFIRKMCCFTSNSEDDEGIDLSKTSSVKDPQHQPSDATSNMAPIPVTELQHQQEQEQQLSSPTTMAQANHVQQALSTSGSSAQQPTSQSQTPYQGTPKPRSIATSSQVNSDPDEIAPVQPKPLRPDNIANARYDRKEMFRKLRQSQQPASSTAPSIASPSIAAPSTSGPAPASPVEMPTSAHD